jgi:membrane protein YqaA with SNARE-associated domain
MVPPETNSLFALARMGELLYSSAAGFGGLGILLVALADSSFLTLPEGNDLLIVVLSAGSTWARMSFFVSVTIIGSVLGCLILYTIGKKGGRPVLQKRFSEANIRRAESLFARFGVFAVVVPSILPPPCPFKIFVLSAGVFRLGGLKFLSAVSIGRSIRYSMWGVLAVLYGNPVKLYIQNNLPAMGMLFFGLFVLILGGVLLVYLIHGHRQREEPKDA